LLRIDPNRVFVSSDVTGLSFQKSTHMRPNLMAVSMFALLAVALVTITGCGGTSNTTAHGGDSSASTHRYSGSYPIHTRATTGMVADLVRNVGGADVEVWQMMGEGVDPHLYKASPGDIAQLQSGDAIFYSGLHLEGKMGDIFVRMARAKPTFAVTERIDETRLLEVTDGYHDPHVWFDVALWSEAASVVADALAEFDSTHADEYRTNAEAYRKELAALDANCRERLATIPAERRVLVTAHDAFHYFGRAYDVEVRAIQGISTESEAGVKEINELVNFIVERGVKAVFVETSVSDRNIKALVEGCAAKGHSVAIGGELFSDAMGEPGTPEGTYIGMVVHNVNTIVSALE